MMRAYICQNRFSNRFCDCQSKPAICTKTSDRENSTLLGRSRDSFVLEVATIVGDVNMQETKDAKSQGNHQALI